MDLAAFVNGVVVAVIPVLVEGFKVLLPRIPRVVVWALPLTFGGILISIGNYLAVLPAGADAWHGIGLGAFALVLRELVTTVEAHGLNA